MKWAGLVITMLSYLIEVYRLLFAFKVLVSFGDMRLPMQFLNGDYAFQPLGFRIQLNKPG